MDTLCRSKQAPYEYTVSVIGGKWKMKIIYELACEPALRYSELKRNIAGITHKMLNSQLKGLEEDGIVVRKEYPQVPPKVEYSLSEEGLSIVPIINEMCKWGKEHKKD
ncbi:winged helix-turn-helix transcriptional regulator [Clostridium sporogenes]|uniref:winged helix-turn-helix transcriptional regulator n=1 Tax=Clostridium sporogenes TaxID=1509 RepID=UPI0028FE05DA|nr:helix-turn-helix domain-containing protein [Clostridium botulinum]